MPTVMQGPHTLCPLQMRMQPPACLLGQHLSPPQVLVLLCLTRSSEHPGVFLAVAAPGWEYQAIEWPLHSGCGTG